MKHYHNHRTEPYFTYLKNGQKIVEGRVRKNWYRFVEPGDLITVNNEEETDHVEVRVKRVNTYSSIKQMLESENLKHLLPDATTVDQGIKIYRRFYTPKQEAKYGVVAIEVETI